MTKSIFVYGNIIPVLECDLGEVAGYGEIITKYYKFKVLRVKGDDFVDLSVSFTDSWKERYIKDIKKTLDESTARGMADLISNTNENKYEIRIWYDGFLKMRNELPEDDLLDMIIRNAVKKDVKKFCVDKIREPTEEELKKIESTVENLVRRDSKKHIERIEQCIKWNSIRVYEDIKSKIHDHIFSNKGGGDNDCIFEHNDIEDNILKERVNKLCMDIIKKHSKQTLNYNVKNVINEFRADRRPYRFFFWASPFLHGRVVSYMSNLDKRIGALKYLNTSLKPISLPDHSIREIDKTLDVLEKSSGIIHMIENTLKVGWQFFALCFVILVGTINLIKPSIDMDFLFAVVIGLCMLIFVILVSYYINTRITKEINKIVELVGN